MSTKCRCATRRKRAKREYEDTEYAAMVRRQVRRLGDRLAAGDPFDLGEFVALQKELDAALEHAVDGQRAHGFSWSAIGSPLGITRQAAQQRFRKPVA